MKKLLLAIALLLASPFLANAQTTLQVTDAGSQTWNNGTWSVQLVVGGNIQYGGLFYVNGVVVPNQVQSGNLSNTGSATITLTPNNTITPVPTLWNYTICPNANATCFTQGVNITTSNQAVTLTPPIPQVTAANSGVTKAYSDAEIVNALPGAQYYNIVSNQQRICNGPPVCTWSTAGANPATLSPVLQHIAVSPNCPAASSTCFTVANDGHVVSDATWSAGANVQVTLGASDPHPQCPGGVYPCNSSTPGCNASQTNLPNTSCDIFKIAFGTANCRAINPGQCDGSIPAGTISSIQSAMQLTLTSTASTASSTGSGFTQFAWFTSDDTPLAAAADTAFKSNVPTQVDLPCGYMGYTQSDFAPYRVTRVNSVSVFFNGYHCATFIVPPNFNCTASAGSGCLLSVSGGAGQIAPAVQMWADHSEGIVFLGLGQDSPTTISTQFPATTSSLIAEGAYTSTKDVSVVGLFWNASKTIYGHYCVNCSLDANGVSWSAGSRGLYALGAVQGTTTILSGFYGNDISHSCDIDGGNVVYLSGTQCNFPLNNNSTEAGAGLDTLSTFTGELWVNGANIQGSPYLNGGTVHLSGFYNNPQGGASGIFVQNANVKLYVHEWHNQPNGGPWLHLSAGFVHLDCGASPWTSGYTGSNAATITGGTFQMDACQVGGANLAAQTAAISASTLFTVGASTALFRAHLSVECTTTSAAATVTPSILYTDTSNTAQTVTGAAATCTTLGSGSVTSQDVTFRAKNATNIQYQTTIANTPTYDVSVAVEQLSLN